MLHYNKVGAQIELETAYPIDNRKYFLSVR